LLIFWLTASVRGRLEAGGNWLEIMKYPSSSSGMKVEGQRMNMTAAVAETIRKIINVTS
jgi:hypothetical protein